MIASTQIRNTKIFAFIPVVVFKLFSCKVLLINRKDNKTVKKPLKVGYFQISNSKIPGEITENL